MSIKKAIAVVLIFLVIGCVVYYVVNPISVLVLEVAYTTFPIMVNKQLRDIEFTFNANRYSTHIPTYQLGLQHNVVTGITKLSIIDLQLNFTIDINVFKETENGTLWRSIHLVFSSVNERKIQMYCQKPANATLGNRAVIVVDAHLVAWYKGQAPYIDKAIHKVFAIDISSGS